MEAFNDNAGFGISSGSVSELSSAGSRVWGEKCGLKIMYFEIYRIMILQITRKNK
jgi:hypothetical protein